MKRQAQTRNKLKITFKILHNNYIPLFTNTILTLKLARFLRLSTHHFSHHTWNPESTALESRIQDCLGNLYMGHNFFTTKLNATPLPSQLPLFVYTSSFVLSLQPTCGFHDYTNNTKMDLRTSSRTQHYLPSSTNFCQKL